MTTSVIHLDFETRSTVDLREVGLDNYARHSSTDVWCAAWALNDQVPVLWTPTSEVQWPKHASISSTTFVCHNAAFELAIWNNIMVPRYGWPELKPEQVFCTMAQAYAMGLPGALDDAAAAVGLNTRKDQSGKRLMLQLCRPREIRPDGTVVWWDDDERLNRLYEYCKQDVLVERELHRRLVPLSAREREVWLLDHKINQCGVPIDAQAVRAAIGVVELEKVRLNNEIRNITGNAVGFTTEVARLTKWVRDRGVDIQALAKADVLDALGLDDLPDDVRRALEVRQQGGKTSTAKLTAMLESASPDGRVRGTLQYHGASTGRWAGRRLQTHNLMRPTMKQAQIEHALAVTIRHAATEAVAVLDMFYGPPMEVVANCVRALICAPKGRELVACDFANIEGRVLAWLAGEDWKVQAFAQFDEGIGPDTYKLAYSKSFHVPVADVTKEQRQIGKVEELALGYQGGVGAFQQMARGYGVKVTDVRAEEIKIAWRDIHPAICRFWYAIEDAAVQAVRYPGQTFVAGQPSRPVKFKKAGSFLFCLLPSGRAICYPYPQIKETETPWGELKDSLTYMTVVDQTRRKSEKIVEDPNAAGSWQRVATYGGKLAENVTQAVARDLLAEALVRLDSAGMKIVMHVHDEIVGEVKASAPATVLKDMERIMSQPPGWAAGLPIAAEGWRGRRYRKG